MNVGLLLTPSELALILRREVARGGFALDPASCSEAALAALVATHTTAAQRAAMNGGLATQLFRKARSHLDAGLDLATCAPGDLCALTLDHFKLAARDLPTPAKGRGR